LVEIFIFSYIWRMNTREACKPVDSVGYDGMSTK